MGKRLQDPALVQDLIQDLFLKLQQKDYQDVQYPKAYLYRMANSLVVDEQRRQSRFVDTPQNHESEPDDIRTPEAHLQHQQRLATVNRALQDLPDKTRDIFCLVRVRQLDKHKVAEQMQISVNMVEKHLRKALEYCQMQIKKSE